MDAETLVVIAAAVAWALRRGMRQPVVRRVTPTPTPAASPWVWVGRAQQMAARRQVARRPYSSR